MMIARLWHGVTKAEDADVYYDYLKRTGLSDYRSVEGNLGVQVLRRIEGDKAHFLLITHWDSLDAIKRFAGEDYTQARYYSEDARYLLELEERVEHYEILDVEE
ncbi:MAG: antibiotic biosynthesis monooxygenase [Anaerolineae bacterium]|nr:antibiotic biosynthesis monooxygenase [Anaerolineae bacterium]